jgi:hypothetical protein
MGTDEGLSWQMTIPSRDPFDLDVVRFFLNLGEIIFHLHP